MSDHNGHRGGPPPPQDQPQESAYPPPPGEEDDRQRYQHLPQPQALPNMTLPPIQDPHVAYSTSRYPPPPDPRSRGNYSQSPTGGPNGYPPPPATTYPLPPVQPPPDPRYGVEQRPDYYQRGGSFPPPPPPEHYNYGYRPPTGSPYGSYPPEYARGPAPPQQAAPRQRTSIACSYCRRRKIRCSGYAQTPDGMCTNCRKTGNKCIFQPVSSSSTTAFVPVSAVPGGVPPGTPLYGAFGQPLAQGAAPGGQPAGAALPPPSSGAPPAFAQQPQQGPESSYGLPSPTVSYYPPPPEDRDARRRRPREEDHAQRLPPPNVYGEPDPRRRSPASASPPQQLYEYPPPNTANHETVERTGTPRRDSPKSPQQGQQTSGPMSLSSLIEHAPPRPPPGSDSGRDIDKNMLTRLNRRT